MNSRIRTPSMRLVRKQKNQWPNPELSVGHYLGTKNPNYHYYAAQGPAKEAFDNIKAEIQELIETTCGPVRGSGLMFQELYMVGDTPSSAVPYIMISYKKIDVRKKAVAALKEAKVLERCPAGMKIGHWNYPPHVVNQDGFGSSSVTITSRDVSETLECNLVPTADPKVSWKTGAIRLTVNHDNIHRLHNGTIGSIIIVDEKSFYFAPAHVFDSDISDEVTEDGDSECDFGSFVEEDEGFDEDAEVDFMSRYSVTPGSRLSPNDDYPDYGEHSETSSIIQDSHWMLPEPEEHLVESSHSSHMKDEFQTTPSLPPLPTLTIKRPHILSNDMDYSLIEVSTNNSLKSSNLPVLTRENVRSIERDGIEVTAQTGLGVILTGTLSNRPSYTLLPNSTKFQEVFTVKLSGAASKPGDCGTIIRDANTGGIYGHIIAGSVESKVAYIMPAITVLNDLEKRLGAAGALETIDHPSIHVTTTDNGLGIVNADESEIDRRNWPGVPMKTSMARMKVTLDDSKEISMLNWLSGLDYDHEHNHKENVGAADSPLPSSEVDESESLVIVPENREQIQNPRSCRARRQSSPIPDDFASLSDLEQSINAAETMLFDTNRPIESQCSTGVVTSTSPSISNITRLSHLTREDTALCSEIELTSAFDDVLGIVPDIFGKSDSQQYEPWQACEDTAPNHEGLHLDDSQSLIVKNHLRRCNEIFDLDKKIGDSGNPEEARENRDRNQLSPEDYTVGWICSLPHEMEAMKTMLDETHSPIFEGSTDLQDYNFGRIGDHNIVIACPSSSAYGTTSGTKTTSRMQETFPSLKVVTMMGIGAGGSSKRDEIRLRDLVVNDTYDEYMKVVSDYTPRQAKSINQRQMGTADWLLRSPELQSWASRNDHGKLLWIQRKPGSGKNVIASDAFDSPLWEDDTMFANGSQRAIRDIISASREYRSRLRAMKARPAIFNVIPHSTGTFILMSEPTLPKSSVFQTGTCHPKILPIWPPSIHICQTHIQEHHLFVNQSQQELITQLLNDCFQQQNIPTSGDRPRVLEILDGSQEDHIRKKNHPENSSSHSADQCVTLATDYYMNELVDLLRTDYLQTGFLQNHKLLSFGVSLHGPQTYQATIPTSVNERIHHYTTPSRNLVTKKSIARNLFANRNEDICFEMEAAGLMNNFPCLVIRGICDYSDSHKNNNWQKFAAATVSEYIKQLLFVLELEAFDGLTTHGISSQFSSTRLPAFQDVPTAQPGLKVILQPRHPLKNPGAFTLLVLKQQLDSGNFQEARYNDAAEWLSPTTSTSNAHKPASRPPPVRRLRP